MITDGAIGGLARIDALHTGLTQIVLEGGDLVGIADEVSRALDVGVVVTSTDGRQRAAALSDGQRSLLEAHDLVEPTGRLRVERVVGEAAPVGEGEVLGLRVAAGGTDLARLVCVRVDGPLTSDDVQALERAAAVAALLITQHEAITAVENKYQGDFLRDILLRRAVGEDYVTEHVETFGWDLRLPLVVVAAEIDPPAAGRAHSRPARPDGTGRSASPRPGVRSVPGSARGSRRSTSPPRWSPCSRSRGRGVRPRPGHRRPRGQGGVRRQGRRPPVVLGRREPAGAAPSTTCPRPTRRPAARPRSAAG